MRGSGVGGEKRKEFAKIIAMDEVQRGGAKSIVIKLVTISKEKPNHQAIGRDKKEQNKKTLMI